MEYTTVSKDKEYIPAWDGNAKREEDEQVVFTLRYLPDSQRSKCFKIGIDKDGNETVDPNYELLVKYGVVEIKNFRVDGVDITTARQFGSLSGFTDLYMEIGTQILIMNARQDSKNL
jgi:hypothetical protein